MHYRVLLISYNGHSKSYSLTTASGHKPDPLTIDSEKSNVAVYPDKYGANGPIHPLEGPPDYFSSVYDKVF
jgi:hypothetical protein